MPSTSPRSATVVLLLHTCCGRSDQAIKPTPVTGVVLTAAADLVLEYERFLRQLRATWSRLP